MHIAFVGWFCICIFTMADPFSSFKNADFATASRPPPPAAQRPPSRPHSAHPSNPSSPTNRSRSNSTPVQPATPVKPAKPYKRVEPPARIVYHGTLLKQSSRLLFHTYSARYVILSPAELWLYESETAFDERREPLRVVKLEKSTYVMDEGHSGNKIMLVSGGKTTVLKEERAGDVAEWKRLIEDCLNQVKSATAYNMGQPQSLAVR